jgi:transposase
MGAVSEHGRPRVDDPTRLDGVSALGLDETAFQAASATRSTSFVTGIVDLTRHGGPARLLDVIDDRSASALVSWVNQREARWRAGITTASLDPYRGYASALRAALPHAVRVLDAFHVIRLGFAAVDEVRRRIQRELTGHRRRAARPHLDRRPGAAPALPRPRPGPCRAGPLPVAGLLRRRRRPRTRPAGPHHRLLAHRFAGAAARRPD